LKTYGNLLDVPVFTATTTGEQKVKLTLPQLFSAYEKDAIERLDYLRPDHEDAFHVFMACLGEMVLHNAEMASGEGEDFWKTGLLALTQQQTAPWTLFVEDLGQAAFMQPPLTGFAAERLTRVEAAERIGAEALENIISSKNHDIKTDSVQAIELEDWAYALIAFQTRAPYLGSGKYSISRMNGGWGARVICALRYDQTPGQRWQQDVARLQALRPGLTQAPAFYTNKGIGLVWVLPWDGEQSLSLTELSPFFIEIARAFRLHRTDEGHVLLRKSTSRSRRIDAEEFNGVIGDPWTPLKAGAEESWTPSSRFGVREIRDLIFGDGALLPAPMLSVLQNCKRPARFYCNTLIGGQGKNEGYIQTSLPIPQKVLPSLFRHTLVNDYLARLTKSAIESADRFYEKVLSATLSEISKEVLLGDHFIKTAKEPFRASWEDHLFEFAWQQAEMNDLDRSLRVWHEKLIHNGRNLLDTACQTLPASRRYKVQAAVMRRYGYKVNKNFPLNTQD